MAVTICLLRQNIYHHLSIGHLNIFGCVWKCCVPLNPMVLLIIIPFLNGYFIGNIPYFQTNPHSYKTYRAWYIYIYITIILVMAVTICLLRQNIYHHLSIGHLNIFGCVWKCCVPLNPMVLLIIIPFLNGYFIGNIPYFQTNPHSYKTYRAWYIYITIILVMAVTICLLRQNIYHHLSIGHLNIFGCVWKCCVPLNPMVLLIIIPFLNGYFIGNIPYFQTNPHSYKTYRAWYIYIYNNNINYQIVLINIIIYVF